MAHDFAGLPATGITPVICGDAHLGNFGFYASPERDLVFDLNDFDEAHPGRWEWDLRRLVTSVWVASRQNGCDRGRRGGRRPSCIAAYRDEVRELAEQPLLSRAFERLDLDRLRRARSDEGFGGRSRRAARRAREPDERPRAAEVHRAARRPPPHRRGAAPDHAASTTASASSSPRRWTPTC